MGVFSAALCLPAAREGGWEGGHRGKRLQQKHRGSSCAPCLRAAKTVTTSHWSNSTSLWGVSRGHAVPGLHHPKVLSGSLWGISPVENSLRAVHASSAGMPISTGTRAFTHWCFACARGNLPARVLPAGPRAECVAMGTFSCHKLIFFPMPGQAPGELVPFQHTRGCSEVWALLLRARQVTSHVLTCGLVCREEGCCRAGHTRVACLVVADTQSRATVSLLWGEEVAETGVCSAVGAGRSCLHARTHTLFLLCDRQSDAFCI